MNKQAALLAVLLLAAGCSQRDEPTTVKEPVSRPAPVEEAPTVFEAPQDKPEPEPVEEAPKPWEGRCLAAGERLRFVAKEIQHASDGIYITEMDGKVTRLDGDVSCVWNVPPGAFE